jgi:hypothetical protein
MSNSARGNRERTVVDPERLELPTPAFEAQCSIQLSYGSYFLRTHEIVYIVALKSPALSPQNNGESRPVPPGPNDLMGTG